MNEKVLLHHFGRIGAQLEVGIVPADNWRFARRWWRGDNSLRSFSLGVRDDGRGEVFELTVRQDAYEGLEMLAVDVQPERKHLLLYACEASSLCNRKFLCGHDGRHWFAVVLPNTAGSVKTVDEALDALRPMSVLASQATLGARPSKWNRRRKVEFARQET